jgi:UDP-glucose 4-epimerase
VTEKSWILVTGGSGYIGTHACVALAGAGFGFIVVDNFSNSVPAALDRVATISGTHVEHVRGDVRDGAFLDGVFATRRFAAVVHFAGLKAVGESVADPVGYYQNNVVGTLELVAAMERADVRSLVFSSSATVYGQSRDMPLTEAAPRSATNPYGRSKLFVEHILEDLCASDPRWGVAALRYFNPVGAHESGLIGENPLGVPNNLMPYIAQVAVGRRPRLSVFGDDYPTRDGTGIRDYIHVMDLAEGHVAALRFLERERGCHALNLGTGRGTSVLEIMRAFERASGRQIPYAIEPRRPGDVAECWADAARATAMLSWSAKRSLEQMCADTWRWQSANPQGYAAEAA